MQIEQWVSVVIRMVAGFYFVRHVAQFALSVPSLIGMMSSADSFGGSSLVLWGSVAIIGAELVAFRKSRVLAQWLLEDA